MQDCIDNCGCGYATQGAIKNLWGHLDKFAFEIDLIDKIEICEAEKENNKRSQQVHIYYLGIGKIDLE